jgi:Helix-turn-helix domain
MSGRELERGEVMDRVASGDLRLQHAAEMLELSYRQTKRVWRRYRERGEGLKHGNAGRELNRGGAEVYYRSQRILLHEIAEPVRRTAEPSPPAARIVVRKRRSPIILVGWVTKCEWGGEPRWPRPPLSRVLPLRPKKQGYTAGRGTTE